MREAEIGRKNRHRVTVHGATTMISSKKNTHRMSGYVVSNLYVNIKRSRFYKVEFMTFL